MTGTFRGIGTCANSFHNVDSIAPSTVRSDGLCSARRRSDDSLVEHRGVADPAAFTEQQEPVVVEVTQIAVAVGATLLTQQRNGNLTLRGVSPIYWLPIPASSLPIWYPWMAHGIPVSNYCNGGGCAASTAATVGLVSFTRAACSAADKPASGTLSVITPMVPATLEMIRQRPLVTAVDSVGCPRMRTAQSA